MISFRNNFLQNFFGNFQFSKNCFVTIGQNLKPCWDWGTSSQYQNITTNSETAMLSNPENWINNF